MAITLVNLTGDITDLITEDFDARRTKVWIEANVDHIADLDNNVIRLGTSQPKSVNTDGTFTLADLVATGSADTNLDDSADLQYQLWVDYPASPLTGMKRVRKSFGWYAIPTTANVIDLVEAQQLEPTWQSGLDAAMAGLVPAGAFADALTASIAVQSVRLEGVPLWAYGSSFLLDVPSTAWTAGMEFWKLVRDRLRMSTATTFGVSGKSIRHTAKLLNGGVGVTDALWPTTRKGVALIDTYVNDLSMHNASTTPQAYTAKIIAGLKSNLRSALAAITASSRLEQTAGAAVTGTWTTTSQNIYSGGSVRWADAPSESWQWTGVTFPASGYIFLGLVALDPASTFVSAAVEVYIDGVLSQTITAADLECSQITEGLTTDAASNAAFRINASPGSHTVKVVHAGTAGQFVYVDALYIPAAQSVANPILVIQDPLPVASAGGYDAGEVATLAANKPQLDALYAEVLADFPNAIWVPTTLAAASDYWSGDGLHPNDRGMSKKADETVLALLDYLNTVRPDKLHALL